MPERPEMIPIRCPQCEEILGKCARLRRDRAPAVQSPPGPPSLLVSEDRARRGVPVMKHVLLLACALAALGTSVRADDKKDATHYNRLLGHGINLGNALEAPRERAWGLTLEEDYFER